MADPKTDETPKAAAEKGPAKRAYIALTEIEHDLKPVAPGKPLMLTEDEAEPLLACTPPAIKLKGKAADADAE